MSSQEQKQMIEINGIKLEVDLRTARRIEEFRIGDRVKILRKEYSDTFTVYPGIIVGFDNFKNLPTITVVYLKSDYSTTELKLAFINAKSTDLEMVHAEYEDLPVHKADVIDKFDNMILKKQAELEDLYRQKRFFIKHFERNFKDAGHGVSDEG